MEGQYKAKVMHEVEDLDGGQQRHVLMRVDQTFIAEYVTENGFCGPETISMEINPVESSCGGFIIEFGVESDSIMVIPGSHRVSDTECIDDPERILKFGKDGFGGVLRMEDLCNLQGCIDNDDDDQAMVIIDRMKKSIYAAFEIGSDSD